MTTPTFINIGPGRCATSWLLGCLVSHPEIAMASVKETEYFNTHLDHGEEWYRGKFPETDLPAIGEISTNYYLDDAVADLIQQYDSDLKIVINLRQPYRLLESFHGFGLRRGLELGSFAESLDFPIGRIMGSGYDYRLAKNILTTADKASLLESVCLADRLRPFLETFEPHQVHFFIFERLQTEHQQVLSDLYEFLEVSKDFVPPDADKIVNSSMAPKSKLLARLATRTSFLLRQVGAHGLLSRLHKSELIKKLLFNKSNSSESSTDLATCRSQLDEATVRRLDAQIEQMKTLCPDLNRWW